MLSYKYKKQIQTYVGQSEILSVKTLWNNILRHVCIHVYQRYFKGEMLVGQMKILERKNSSFV